MHILYIHIFLCKAETKSSIGGRDQLQRGGGRLRSGRGVAVGAAFAGGGGGSGSAGGRGPHLGGQSLQEGRQVAPGDSGTEGEPASRGYVFFWLVDARKMVVDIFVLRASYWSD